MNHGLWGSRPTLLDLLTKLTPLGVGDKYFPRFYDENLLATGRC